MTGPRPPQRASYGLDAPYLLAIPVILIVAALVQGVLTGTPWPFVGAALLVVCTGFGLYASRRGKFVVWAEVLDELDLQGDERVLDLGCGCGAVLLLAARHLTSGHAVGVDLWRPTDQSGNALERTRRNAVIEGVSDRVELHTADIAALPFDEASFDLVVSSLALHNLSSRAQRRALGEAVRVLRPGGRLLIADLRGTGHYLEPLRDLGMVKVTYRNLGWRLWWSGPWLATRLIAATKPPSGSEPAARR